MKFIKKIWDFIAKPFSMHFWRNLWVKICVFSYRKSVDAKILEELCGYMNPPYSGLVDRISEAMRQEANYLGVQCKLPIPFFLKPDILSSFYNDREDFLIQLREFLDSSILSTQAASLYEELRATYALIPDKFAEIVKGLEGRVNLLPAQGFAEPILEFKRIKVEGKAVLNLGGRLNHWSFNRVKFCDAITINIFPSLLVNSVGVMIFRKNICFKNFKCLFACVGHIHIADNEFKSLVQVAADMRNPVSRDVIHQWAKDMMGRDFTTDFDVNSSVVFSRNNFKKTVSFFNRLDKPDHTGIKKVNFMKGNIIAGLSSPEVLTPDKATPKLGVYVLPSDATGIDDVRFGINERIKDSSIIKDLAAASYKDFFIALKNHAVKKRDREAEFNYSRKERYFDWCLADRWQDRFIMAWSHIASDSGISWVRPIIILLFVQEILAFAFIICSFLFNPGWLAGCGWDIYPKIVIESLDPLSDIETACDSPPNSLLASLYGVARKIFLFLFLYETVKAFRRFSK